MSLSRLTELVSIRTISPAYLSEADYPWLRALLDERERFVGHKRRHWKIRVGEPMPIAAPRTKLAVAVRVLDRMAQDQASGAARARKVRAAVFGQAAKEPEPANGAPSLQLTELVPVLSEGVGEVTSIEPEGIAVVTLIVQLDATETPTSRDAASAAGPRASA